MTNRSRATLSPEVRALLDAERDIPAQPAAVRARALARARAAIEAGVAAPPAPTARRAAAVTLRWAAAPRDGLRDHGCGGRRDLRGQRRTWRAARRSGPGAASARRPAPEATTPPASVRCRSTTRQPPRPRVIAHGAAVAGRCRPRGAAPSAASARRGRARETSLRRCRRSPSTRADSRTAAWRRSARRCG